MFWRKIKYLAYIIGLVLAIIIIIVLMVKLL